MRWFLNQPLWVLVACVFFVTTHLSCNDTLARIWNLSLKQKQLTQRIKDLKEKNKLVVERLNKLSDPLFLEKEARNRLNLVGERDLVFIFSDNDQSKKPIDSQKKNNLEKPHRDQ